MISEAPIVHLQQVEKVYGTAVNPLRVLHGIDLRIDRGEYVTIVGRSGAGKSTLLNILGCLDRPTGGSYHLMGDDVAGFNDQQLSTVRRLRLGFVFQAFQLITHLTLLENVEMPLFYARQHKRHRRRRCLELLDRVGLSDRAEHLPSELSGGENQRAAIARALANDPAILLADEPTGNLDSATSDSIMGLLRSLNDAGRTIVLITHDEEIARSAPRQVTLRDGIIEKDHAREGSR